MQFNDAINDATQMKLKGVLRLRLFIPININCVRVGERKS
jgi:hypothetical protein